MKFWSSIIKGNRVLIALIGALLVCSFVLMASAASQIAFKSEHLFDPLVSHAKFLAAGIFIMILFSNIHYKYFRILGYPLIVVSFILLLITPLVGQEVNGAIRSISIFGFDFQPLELGKVSVVLLLSDVLSRYQNGKQMSAKHFLILLAVIVAFCALIALQNLSTAVMLFIVAFSMMVIGRVEFKKIALLVAAIIFLLLLAFAWIKIFPDSTPKRAATWANRIEGFVTEMNAESDDPSRYVITDDNFQIMNSKIAIANGKNPSGPGNSEQRDYLPLAFSDFIFAVEVEEYGIFGAVLIIALYIGILIIGGQTARHCDQAYPALLVVGLSILIVLQALISMAVTVQLGPVTGQPLPLISRGGTSILITSGYLGIILSISQYVKDIQLNQAVQATQKNNNAENTEETEIIDLSTISDSPETAVADNTEQL